MARKSKNLQGRSSIAIIVDGKDEKWYFERVRQSYPCKKLREIKVEPLLPQKKKVKELFDLAKRTIENGSERVFLCIDLDEPLKEPKEFSVFITLYLQYSQLKNGNVTRMNKWMKQLTIIVNNPCLEYWFLLHFKNTNKFYSAYEPELKADLRRCPSMEQYEKSEVYYNRTPNIYDRLRGVDGINAARANAKKFTLAGCKHAGGSEMFKIFDFFDQL